MRPEDLLKRLEGRPFRPFRLHLSDGAKIDVREPGMVIVVRSTAILPTRFVRRNGYRIAEDWQTVALARIVRTSELRARGKR